MHILWQLLYITIVTGIADRNQGVEYANDLAESCRQVRTYVANLETEIKERAALIEMLEQSELYYDAQASEANTVAMVSVCGLHCSPSVSCDLYYLLLCSF